MDMRVSYVGVEPQAHGPRYRAKIRLREGKRKHLGTFDTAREAAMAYDRALVERNGPGSEVNFTSTERSQVPD